MFLGIKLIGLTPKEFFSSHLYAFLPHCLKSIRVWQALQKLTKFVGNLQFPGIKLQQKCITLSILGEVASFILSCTL